MDFDMIQRIIRTLFADEIDRYVQKSAYAKFRIKMSQALTGLGRVYLRSTLSSLFILKKISCLNEKLHSFLNSNFHCVKRIQSRSQESLSASLIS